MLFRSWKYGGEKWSQAEIKQAANNFLVKSKIEPEPVKESPTKTSKAFSFKDEDDFPILVKPVKPVKTKAVVIPKAKQEPGELHKGPGQKTEEELLYQFLAEEFTFFFEDPEVDIPKAEQDPEPKKTKEELIDVSDISFIWEPETAAEQSSGELHKGPGQSRAEQGLIDLLLQESLEEFAKAVQTAEIIKRKKKAMKKQRQKKEKRDLLDNTMWILVCGFLTGDRKSTRLNSSHSQQSRMPSSA